MAPSRTVKSKSRPRRDPSSHGVLRPHKSPKGSYLYVKNLDAPGASSSKLERHSNDLDVELPVDAEAVVDKGELLTDDSILRLQKDPLSVLDDLSFDLVLQCFDVKDLLTACAVSRLWRRRMDTWILNSTSRLQKLVLGVPVGLDPKMKPEEFLTSWRRKASIHVRKQNAQPTKAMKLCHVVHGLCDTLDGTVVWFRHEDPDISDHRSHESQLHRKRSTILFRPQSPYNQFCAFEYTYLCVQQPITPSSVSDPPGTVKQVLFQDLFLSTQRSRNFQQYNYRPLSIKLWHDPNHKKRILAIIQAAMIHIPEQRDHYRLDLGSSYGWNNTYLTLAVNVSTLVPVWYLDNVCSTLGCPSGPTDTTISESGTYAMICRGRPRDSTLQSWEAMCLLTYDVRTGKRKNIYHHLPPSQYHHWWSREYFVKPQRILAHPTLNIFFLARDIWNKVLVVTSTGTYEFPRFPELQCIIESYSDNGLDFHGSNYFSVSFDSSPTHRLHLSRYNPAGDEMVVFVFTYDIHPSLETLETPDIKSLIRLRRARQFTIPNKLIVDYSWKLHEAPGKLFSSDLFDIEKHQMSGVKGSKTAMYSLTTPAPTQYVVVQYDGKVRTGPEIEVEHFRPAEGVLVTTRVKKKTVHVDGGGNNASVEKMDPKRRVLPVIHGTRRWMKTMGDTAMMWGENQVIWMGFETGVGVEVGEN